MKKRLRRRIYILLIIIAGLLLVSLLAPLVAPHDPNQTNPLAIRLPPGGEYLLGTDNMGRCVFSRVIYGARTSIFSTMLLVGVSFGLGSAVGILCGYYEGIFDKIVMGVVDLLLAFPQMVLAIAVAGIIGGSLTNALLAIGLSSWIVYAKLARTHTMSIKHDAFILAAKLNGCSDYCILRHHIFPNIFGALIVNAATQIGVTLMSISGLSFLGLGVVPPQIEWGAMINESRAYIQISPWTVLAPAGAVLLCIMLFNYLGDALRDLSSCTKAG